MKEEKLICESCYYFKNKQRELNYHGNIGFCVNELFSFNISRGRLIGVYDKNNQKDINQVSGNPYHDIETLSNMNVKQSRYLLQVSTEFGCIYHKKNK